MNTRAEEARAQARADLKENGSESALASVCLMDAGVMEAMLEAKKLARAQNIETKALFEAQARLLANYWTASLKRGLSDLELAQAFCVFEDIFNQALDLMLQGYLARESIGE